MKSTTATLLSAVIIFLLLPERLTNETDDDYYSRIFVTKDSNETSNSAFYKNVFSEYKAESKDDYVKRIDTVFEKVFPNLDPRSDSSRNMEKYYTYKYGKNSNESDEDYLKRVLNEGSELERNRANVEILKKYIKNVDWSKAETLILKSEGTESSNLQE